MKEEVIDTNSPCLTIEGLVRESKMHTLSQLLEMDTIEITDLLHACGSGEPKGRISQCRGILLTDIITTAEVSITDHNDTKKMYVIARSVDGYSTLFSWQELFNSEVGEGVILITEKDGEKIPEKRTHLDIISTKDFLTGPRYVKQAATLKILMIV